MEQIVKSREPVIKKMEDTELSGVMIVIIIGGGVLTFIILFIFAKRQIMRFALRSRRGPHVPVGHDSKKSLKKEINRRLDCIQKIIYEPKLIWNNDEYIIAPGSNLPAYYYRMKAVDEVKLIEREIGRSDGTTRPVHESLRSFLITSLVSPQCGADPRQVHQFCDLYEHARHDPNEFSADEYEEYHRLLLKLIELARLLKSYGNTKKSSPSRTPNKKHTKMHSLLDPSRLRPPPISSRVNAGENNQSRINLTLGLQQQQNQRPPQIIDDENEIICVSQYHGDVKTA